MGNDVEGGVAKRSFSIGGLRVRIPLPPAGSPLRTRLPLPSALAPWCWSAKRLAVQLSDAKTEARWSPPEERQPQRACRGGPRFARTARIGPHAATQRGTHPVI